MSGTPEAIGAVTAEAIAAISEAIRRFADRNPVDEDTGAGGEWIGALLQPVSSGSMGRARRWEW